MLSDQFDGLHYGLVLLGGYTPYGEMTPAGRQRMLASRTMGANRYMATVLQQNRVAGGEDTDMVDATAVAAGGRYNGNCRK